MKAAQSLLSPQALASVGVIAVVLIVNAIAVHGNAVSLHETHALTARTHDILAQSEQIVTGLLEAESGIRGYLITRNASCLASYRQATESLKELLGSLRASVTNNPFLLAKAKLIEKQTHQRLDQLATILSASSYEGFDAARSLVGSDAGQQTMQELHQALDSLKRASTELLQERHAEADRKLSTILIANIVGVALALLVSSVSWMLIDRQIRKCRDAEAQADSERENLLVTLTSIGDAVVVTDQWRKIQLANPIAEKLIGNGAGLLGKSLEEVFLLINQSSREQIQDPIAIASHTPKSMSLSDPALLLRSDFTEIPIEHTASPIRNRLGKITGYVLVFRDCSERWRFERELLRREQRFRKMFETPMLGIAVGTADGKGLLEANDAYLDLIGYDRGEVVDSSLGWGGVIAEQSPLDEQAQKQLRETGVCRPFEKVYTRSDGTLVPVLISSTKLFDDDDGIIVFVTDLTRAKQSEDALRESEDRFRILSESMPQMVWMSLPDGQFVYVNQTMLQYTGRPVEELVGWGWVDLLHDEEKEQLIKGWKVALRTGEPLEIEHRIRNRDGEYRWYLTRARPMYGGRDRIIRWVGTNTDIHDHKVVETLLREEHQRKDKFLALLAHELRNPLAPLANAVQVLQSVQRDPVASGELVALMQRQIRQMTRLIDDLLDIARLTQDRIVLRRERSEVGGIIQSALETMQPCIDEHSHTLTVSPAAQPLWIDADTTRVSQILINLLENAAKYTPPGGKISLVVERINNTVCFRVRDTGIGIAPSLLPHVFDQFMNAEQTLNRTHGGLGIGLKLVRGLVELHGGNVSVQSDGLGQGSEFIVSLPLAEELKTLPAAALPAKPADTVRFSHLKILVVDDVKASAKTLALMLSVLGPRVETAFDGATAIERVSVEPFDVVFLDIAMPGMDGLEVARQIRTCPHLADLWLVALTGFGQDNDRQRSFDAGFNEHIIKPANMTALEEVLQHVLERKSPVETVGSP